MNETQPTNIKSAVYGVVTILVIILVLSGIVSFIRSGAFQPKIDGPVINYIPEERVLKNEVYGFEITTPAGVDATTTFAQYYALSNKWRADAPLGGEGVNVLAIPIIQMDNNNVLATSSDSATTSSPRKIYPLSFVTEVRIGVSSSTADCLRRISGQTVKDVTLGGYPFKRFSFGDAAMMHYVQGESYRAVRNGLCYAIERIKTGSTYREENMEEALSTKDMDAYYAVALEVLKTFKFTK